MISHIYSDLNWEDDSSIAGFATDSISGIENVFLQVKNLSNDTYWYNGEMDGRHQLDSIIWI